MITINLEKAKEIWRNKIRADRMPIFDSLDIEYMKALETNDTTKQNSVIAKKQKLRDAPQDPRIDAANSIEELQTINPIEEIQ